MHEFWIKLEWILVPFLKQKFWPCESDPCTTLRLTPQVYMAIALNDTIFTLSGKLSGRGQDQHGHDPRSQNPHRYPLPHGQTQEVIHIFFKVLWIMTIFVFLRTKFFIYIKWLTQTANLWQLSWLKIWPLRKLHLTTGDLSELRSNLRFPSCFEGCIAVFCYPDEWFQDGCLNDLITKERQLGSLRSL